MILFLAMTCVLLAQNDNDVEWDGVSHVPWQDRRPLCPLDGESFEVRFQVYRFDITGAQVIVDDDGTAAYDASFIADRGPYAIWGADLPATGSTRFTYYLAITDGDDTDYYGPDGMSEEPPADGFVIDFETLEHAPLGATLADGGAVFRVWAPSATQAWVRGEFNGWGTTNELSPAGEYFAGFVAGASDRDMYKFFFQPGNIWKPDARARSLNPGDNYNTHVEDRFRYDWDVDDFQMPAFEDLVIYELHVGTFAGRNDAQASGAIPATYADVAAHADHLAELGINAVELTPITEFPWDFSAGYNPVTAWAPEWIHGTPDDFRAMVDELHAHGIAVLLDIVWNHFSPSDNYLWEYDGGQIYFDDPIVDTPWGAQADFGRAEVRDYFLDSALYWLEEMGVDGFRVDATEYMDIQPGGWTLMQELNDLVDRRWADRIVIAEQLPDDPWITRPTDLGGAGFDSQWYDWFTDSLRAAILDMAFGDPEMWRIADILDGSGTYLERTQVVTYLELHDEAWPASGGQRLVRTIDPTFPHDDVYARGRVKLGQGLVMTAPGIPAILQGSEWLEDTDFGGGDPGGANRIDWSKKETYRPIFDYFRDVIAVRRDNPALRANADVNVFHVNEPGNVVAFHRWDLDGNDIVVIANFSNGDYFEYRLGLPRDGTWYELINSQAEQYDGSGLGNGGGVATDDGPYDGFDQSAHLTIPGMGLLVLRYNDPPDVPCPEDLDGDGAVGLSDLSTLLTNFGSSGDVSRKDGDIDQDGDVDLTDLSLLLTVFGSDCPD